MEEYRTVGAEAETEFVERRSRFIGHMRPVKTVEEAVAFVEEVRAANREAAHHVYAYSLRDGQQRRYSDDGEPQGTAGMPVLDVLLKSGVVDAAVVVTRYFGGVLLGAGGLVRAYSHGASLALHEAGIVTMRECVQAAVRCDYSQYGRVQALIPECGGVVENTEFLDDVRLFFHLTEEELTALEVQLADATSGTVGVERLGRQFYSYSL